MTLNNKLHKVNQHENEIFLKISVSFFVAFFFNTVMYAQVQIPVMHLGHF